MEAFNLQNEVNRTLEELNDVDFTSVKSILGWFYKGIELNSMFENEKIATYTYEKLADNGYTEVRNIKEELKTFNSLMSTKDMADSTSIGKSIVAQIMACLKNSTTFDMSLICLIQIYNEKFNKEYASGIMMNSLTKYIGSNVVYVGFKDGNRFFKTGTLIEVEPYKSITIAETPVETVIGGSKIPFIGYGTAISSIHSIDGMCLYTNNLIKEGYNVRDFKEIERLHSEKFGTEYDNLARRGLI